VKRNKYLQLAFNRTFSDFVNIITDIPQDKYIIIEAGTPFLKREGIGVIKRMKAYWPGEIYADLKIVDGAQREVKMASLMGADYVTAVGNSSEETLKIFVKTCQESGIKSVIDMINTPKPLRALWKANVFPDVAMIHRGRDEESSFGKLIQYKNIAKIKSKWDILIGAAGGIDKKEMQSAIFNGADIVVINITHQSDVWKGLTVDKDFHQQVRDFLDYIR